MDEDDSPSRRLHARREGAIAQPARPREDEAYRFDLDHTVPLCLGGAPADERNLQLQPWDEASEKDAAEACLARAVCAEVMTLAEARELIFQDWREAKRLCELK
jgi:carbamate kinase